MPIIDLYNQISKDLDDDYNLCYLFLDLSKAFGTVNRKLLLDKLCYRPVGLAVTRSSLEREV